MDTNSIRNQESCIISCGTTANYFKLEKGTRPGDPISAYLFVSFLEIALLYIKKIKTLGRLSHF